MTKQERHARWMNAFRGRAKVRATIDGLPVDTTPTPSGWTGPDEADLKSDGVSLWKPVPPERWPYCLPDYHEICCLLHNQGLYCDCKASDASDTEHGEQP